MECRSNARSFVEIRTPATAKMKAEAANLAFAAKTFEFSKNENLIINFNSNGLMENGASGSDRKVAQNDSQALKCYLCDGNHKGINCSQNETLKRIGKFSPVLNETLIKIQMVQREPNQMHISGVRRVCNKIECKALRDSGYSICVVRSSIWGDQVG